MQAWREGDVRLLHATRGQYRSRLLRKLWLLYVIHAELGFRFSPAIRLGVPHRTPDQTLVILRLPYQAASGELPEHILHRLPATAHPSQLSCLNPMSISGARFLASRDLLEMSALRYHLAISTLSNGRSCRICIGGFDQLVLGLVAKNGLPTLRTAYRPISAL